jgi:hypothetical protein
MGAALQAEGCTSEFGHTMIYVTHDQTEALTFADKVVVMHDGEVVQIGTPEELFETPGPHLRRLFHRLAGHERAALRGEGNGACVAGAEIGLAGGYGAHGKVRSACGRNSSGCLREGAACRSRCAPSRMSAASRSCGPISSAACDQRSCRPRTPRSPQPMDPGAFRSGEGQCLCRRLAGRGKGRLMDNPVNHKAWFLVLPVVMLVAFNAVIPLMTVVNYSVQDTFGDNQFFWEGLEWFEEILRSERCGTRWAAD